MLTPFAYVSGGAIHFASFIYFINDLWEWKKRCYLTSMKKKNKKKKHSNCKILKYVRHHLYEIGSGSLINKLRTAIIISNWFHFPGSGYKCLMV